MAVRFSAKIQLQAVTELRTGDMTTRQVAEAHGVRPDTVGSSKKNFLENGAEIFAQDNLATECERRTAELESPIGREETEI